MRNQNSCATTVSGHFIAVATGAVIGTGTRLGTFFHRLRCQLISKLCGSGSPIWP